MKRYLIGIDDTDNTASRGTGFLARKMAGQITERSLGKAGLITRHQLFVHVDIPYTSQNSSACLDIMTADIERLKLFCREFLTAESAVGSDAGLAVSAFDTVTDGIVNWGKRAKIEVLTQEEAVCVAVDSKVYLEGLTGSKDGIIGALAAVGLRISGNDGRVIWLAGKEIRGLSGSFRVGDLQNEIAVDQVISKSGDTIPPDDRIELGNWVRPVLKDNLITIIAEKSLNMPDDEWKTADREYIKSITG